MPTGTNLCQLPHDGVGLLVEVVVDAGNGFLLTLGLKIRLNFSTSRKILIERAMGMIKRFDRLPQD